MPRGTSGVRDITAVSDYLIHLTGAFACGWPGWYGFY